MAVTPDPYWITWAKRAYGSHTQVTDYGLLTLMRAYGFPRSPSHQVKGVPFDRALAQRLEKAGWLVRGAARDKGPAWLPVGYPSWEQWACALLPQLLTAWRLSGVGILLVVTTLPPPPTPEATP